MKKNSKLLSLLSLMFITLCFSGLVSCGDDDPGDTPTPKQTISVRSCSITNGTEYEAASLSEVTISYNATVAISNADGILLNGVKCSAKSGSTTAMDVVITLPALEEGKAYTLNIAEGAIVSKTDASVKAPAYSVSFTTKAAPQPINNDATALTKKLGWGWNLGNHFDTSSGEDGVHPQWGYWDNATPTQALYTNLKAAGASTVRMGVTWGNYQDAEWNIEASYIAEIKQNVEWAEAAGLNVIGIRPVNGAEIVADGTVEAYPVGEGDNGIYVGIQIATEDVDVGERRLLLVFPEVPGGENVACTGNCQSYDEGKTHSP